MEIDGVYKDHGILDDLAYWVHSRDERDIRPGRRLGRELDLGRLKQKVGDVLITPLYTKRHFTGLQVPVESDMTLSIFLSTVSVSSSDTYI